MSDMRNLLDIIALLESPNFKTITRVYRGTRRANPDAFDDTRLGKPTFTDVYGIALVYAEVDKGGTVFAYDVSPHNPLVFEGDDPFIDLATIMKALRLGEGDLPALMDQVSQLRYSTDDGDPEVVDWHDLKGMERHARSEIIDMLYTETWRFIDSEFVQARAAAAGYDCIIYRGWFASGSPEYTLPSDSWDGDTSLEWRPLDPAIVKLVGEVSPDDFINGGAMVS